MTSYVWDEGASHHPLRALRLRHPLVPVTTVQELGLSGSSDLAILDVAIATDRAVVTSDRGFHELVESRRQSGDRVKLVFLDATRLSSTEAADQLAVVAEAATAEDWLGTIFIPL